VRQLPLEKVGSDGTIIFIIKMYRNEISFWMNDGWIKLDELFLCFFLFLNKLVITKAEALVSITTPIETTNIPTSLHKLTKVEIIEK
jgi:hypothetical protein